MKILLSLVLLCVSIACEAQTFPMHCGRDTVKIEQIIHYLKEGDKSREEKIIEAANELRGAGFDDYYTSDSIGNLRINVDSFTPLMFINNVAALVKASERPGDPDWRSFASEFENISCRRGEFNGFPSIMYHSSDWIGDNISRGNIKELTENYAGVVVRTKSLDEMTRKRENFAALTDSAVFENARMVEMGFRTHRIPTLKKETVKKKEINEDLRNGDIIILVPNRDGIDLYDIGFIEITNSNPYLIHLSPQTGTIVREKEELSRYMSLMTKYFQGYRIIRLNE